MGSSLGTEARAGSILTSPSVLLKLAGTILFYYRFYSKFFSLGECYFTFQPTSIVSVLLVCLTKSSGHHLFIFSFSRCQLHALHLSHSTDPVSPRAGLLHMSGAPGFAAATQGMPLDHPTLEVRGAGVPGSVSTSSAKSVLSRSLLL